MLSHENDTQRLVEESDGRRKTCCAVRKRISRHSGLCMHPWSDGVRRSRSLWTRCETWQRSKKPPFSVSSPPSRGAAESGQEGRANQCVRGGPAAAAAGRTQHGTLWGREARLLATLFCCFLLVKQSKLLFKPARVWRKIWVAMKSTFSKWMGKKIVMLPSSVPPTFCSKKKKKKYKKKKCNSMFNFKETVCMTNQR